MMIRYLDASTRELIHRENWGFWMGFPGLTGDDLIIIGGQHYRTDDVHWVLSDPESNIPMPYVNVTLRKLDRY